MYELSLYKGYELNFIILYKCYEFYFIISGYLSTMIVFYDWIGHYWFKWFYYISTVYGWVRNLIKPFPVVCLLDYFLTQIYYYWTFIPIYGVDSLKVIFIIWVI